MVLECADIISTVARINSKELAKMFMEQFNKVSCSNQLVFDKAVEALEKTDLSKDYILLYC